MAVYLHMDKQVRCAILKLNNLVNYQYGGFFKLYQGVQILLEGACCTERKIVPKEQPVSDYQYENAYSHHGVFHQDIKICSQR